MSVNNQLSRCLCRPWKAKIVNPNKYLTEICIIWNVSSILSYSGQIEIQGLKLGRQASVIYYRVCNVPTTDMKNPTVSASRSYHNWIQKNAQTIANCKRKISNGHPLIESTKRTIDQDHSTAQLGIFILQFSCLLTSGRNW